MIGFIYKTTCLVNGKIYIGKHQGSESDNYLGSGTVFKCALKKHGKENFQREILRRCNSEHELKIWEYVFIKKYNSQDINIGYNVADGDVNTTEFNPTKRPSVREKISQSQKEYWKKHPENKTKLSNRRKGVPSSDETKKKLSKSHKGIARTDDWKKKISEANSGERHWAFGKELSEEHRRHLSESIKGKMRKEKHPLWGKKMSEETRKKMSEKQKERWQNIQKKRQEK